MEQKKLELGGTFISYIEAGAGPTTLLIPPLAEGSFLYSLQLENVREGRRLVAFDNIGSARSDRPALEYRPIDYLRFAARFLDKVVPPPSVVCAHGDAAPLALALALVRPTAIGEIVLTNPNLEAVTNSKTKSRRRESILSGSLIGRFARGVMVELTVRAKLRRISRIGKGKHPNFSTTALMQALLGPGFKTVALRRAAHAAEWSEWTSRMAEISQPVKVLVGKQVRSRLASSLSILERELPRIEVVDIDEAGAYPMIDTPDEFMRLLLDEHRARPEGTL